MNLNKNLEAKLLTETELELMQILWKLSGGTVHDVMAALPENRKLAYTSVSTILRILDQKMFLKAQKVGRGHGYFPVITKEEYEKRSLSHLLNKVFDGPPSHLVKRLIETDGMKADDLKAIESLIQARLSELK